MWKNKSRKSIWLEHTSCITEKINSYQFLEDIGFDDVNEINTTQACNLVGSCENNIENWLV
jgi:hypothetical protein